MYSYQLNVSINGQFLFATNWMGLEDKHKVLPVIVGKFPSSEGFKVSMLVRNNSMELIELTK